MKATPSLRLAGRRTLLAAALAACALPGVALAQAYPTKPVRVIVSFPPGGAAGVGGAGTVLGGGHDGPFTQILLPGQPPVAGRKPGAPPPPPRASVGR